MRLSIEVTPEQHQRLKAAAAFQGKSIRDYVLERVLPQALTPEETEALQALEAFLEPRIKVAAQGSTASISVTQLFEAVHQSTL